MGTTTVFLIKPNTVSKMKTLIYITVLLAFPMLGIGQTQSENYITTTVYRTAVTENEEDVHHSNKIEEVAYFDGLGRQKQTISIRAGGDKQNIVRYFEYDDLGRSPREYLPYATANEVENDPMEIMGQVVLKTSIENFYDTEKYENTSNPYGEMIYESSPLGRVLEQSGPGNSWAIDLNSDLDHSIKFGYDVNQAEEVYYFNVRFDEGNTTRPLLNFMGYYTEGELYKNTTKDENWTPSSGNNHSTIEFTNKQGQVVLKRNFNGDIPHDTYYVYDDYGNLTFVMSPEASKDMIVNNELRTTHQEVLNDLGYQYKYDYRNRLIEKKVPAKGWEYIIYNLLDQPVLTQDARLRESNQWLLTKYDALGRVAFTGKITADPAWTRAGLQATANNTDAYPTVFEHRVDTPTIIGDTSFYYSNQSFPVSAVSEILTINYYDDYIDTAGMSVPSVNSFGAATAAVTQSLPTVSKVRVLETGDWITTISGYDDKARPIYVEVDNPYLGTRDTVESLLDFTGNTLESISVHTKTGTVTITTRDYFIYDHQNRLLTHKQQINEEPLQLIASNTYDELGQLESKKVGGETTFDGYVDIVNVDVAPDGTMQKNDTGQWSSNLKTKGVIKGNGGIEFVIANDVVNRYRVGLVDATSTNNHFLNFNYAIQLENDVNGNGNGIRDDVKIVGSAVSETLVLDVSYEEGDVFRVERLGSTVRFKLNGQTFHTEEVDPDIHFIGKVVLQTPFAIAGEVSLVGDSIEKALQKVDYAYNVRGWLTDINDIDIDLSTQARGNENDLFSFRINYDDDVIGEAGLPGRAKPLYNGNISQTTWRTANVDSDKHTYGYKYDALNRFKVGYSRKGNTLTDYDHFNVHSLSYDQNGNILSLIRQGDYNGNPLAMDDLTYYYDGNQLLNVSDNGHVNLKNEGFYDGNTTELDYDYDSNGNMIEDKNKGITSITYNHLNLPTLVNINGVDGEGNTQQGNIAYIYDATGVKLQKLVTNSVGIISSTSYAGGYIYEKAGVNATEELKMIAQPEGYIEPEYALTKGKFQKGGERSVSFASFHYAYNYTDHLGNVRLTYKDIDGNGFIKPSTEIISEKHYYPFGLQQKGYNDEVSGNVNHTSERWNFQGQEIQEDLSLNWIQFKWRNHDPAIGRFMTIDPLTEAYRDWGPYVFSGNRIIDSIELEGLEPLSVHRTMDEAAENFGIYYNGASIRMNEEFGSTIYEVVTSSGIQYAYSVPNIGTGGSTVTPSLAPPGSRATGDIHTHAAYDARYANNIFSGIPSGGASNLTSRTSGDIAAYNLLGLTGYIATPNGSLQKYDQTTGIISTIGTNLPSDANDPKRLNTIPAAPNLPTVPLSPEAPVTPVPITPSIVPAPIIPIPPPVIPSTPGTITPPPPVIKT